MVRQPFAPDGSCVIHRACAAATLRPPTTAAAYRRLIKTVPGQGRQTVRKSASAAAGARRNRSDLSMPALPRSSTEWFRSHATAGGWCRTFRRPFRRRSGYHFPLEFRPLSHYNFGSAGVAGTLRKIRRRAVGTARSAGLRKPAKQRRVGAPRARPRQPDENRQGAIRKIGEQDEGPRPRGVAVRRRFR